MLCVSRMVLEFLLQGSAVERMYRGGSMSTEVAPMMGTINGVTSPTEDLKLYVGEYLSAHYSARELDKMCRTAFSREMAAMEIIPDPRATMTDSQRALERYLRLRVSHNPSCWRSLVRDVLADRQSARTTKLFTARQSVTPVRVADLPSSVRTPFQVPSGS